MTTLTLLTPSVPAAARVPAGNGGGLLLSGLLPRLAGAAAVAAVLAAGFALIVG